MRLRITKRQSEYLGQSELQDLNIGIDARRWSWESEQFVDLSKMTGTQFNGFKALVERNKHVRGIGAMFTDITVWKESFNTDQADTRKCANTQQFSVFAKQVIGELPHHYLFKQADEVPGVNHPYYVSKIEYYPKRIVRERGEPPYVIPAKTVIDLKYTSKGGEGGNSLTYESDVVVGGIVKTILAKGGWILETKELYETYMKELGEYMEMVGSLGKQYLADGTAEFHDESESRNYWERSTKSGSYTMERDGERSKVVIDVFSESEKKSNSRYGSMSYVDDSFWKNTEQIKKNLEAEGEYDEEEALENLPEQSGLNEMRIPVPHHLYLVVFDLKRHMRFTIHKKNLEEYKYDTTMGDKLILPDETRTLVTLLVDHRSAEFNDIVKGKSGGAIVLLCGVPGTGKTLTAEVLAEAEKKPLYSVQASQLGTNETELETNLMTVLGRAKRWQAIMLLDESDVYIHQRGNDIHQNAIVGVFLRVLEYYTSVLFLTTNRPDDVDDAVASRCIAKIVYTPFQTEDLRYRAWKVLSEVAKVDVENNELVDLANTMHPITGRDIKNMLKLAKLYTKAKGEKITADVIRLLKKFKPTVDEM